MFFARSTRAHTLAQRLLFAVACLMPSIVQAQWREVPIGTNLRIAPGSALDFSLQFNQAATNISKRVGIVSGRLAVGTTPQRFFCAPLTFTGAWGGYPDKAGAQELATQLRLHGYNLARFHYVDSALMDNVPRAAENDFAYRVDEAQRFRDLLAAFKANGIYWMIDGATAENAAFGMAGPDREVDTPFDMKLKVHYERGQSPGEADYQAHWRGMIDTLLGPLSPHGSLLADPAFMAITLVNELGLNFNLRSIDSLQYPQPIVDGFKAFAGEGVAVPQIKDATPEAAIMQRYLTQLERETLTWMSAHVRSRSATPPLVTAYNNGKAMQSAAVRADLQLVSMHAYHDHPQASAGVDFRDTQQASSAIGGALQSHVQYFSFNRMLGKPFIVDEYDHPYWSGWRREGVAVAAYGAFQNWDGLCRYQQPVAMEYQPGDYIRSEALRPFNIGLDPIGRASETVAALLFRRGDVSPASTRVSLNATDDFLFSRHSGKASLPKGISRLALVTGVGMRRGGLQTGDMLSIPLSKDTVKTVVNGDLLESEQDRLWQNTLALVKTKLTTNASRYDSANEYYESDHKQLALDAKAKTLAVRSGRTEMYVFDRSLPKKRSTDRLMIESASVPAMVALSSLDTATKPRIEKSAKLLLVVATDAVNRGELYGDSIEHEERFKLLEQGALPVLIRSIDLVLTLKLDPLLNFAVYPLNLDGSRRTSPSGVLSLPLEKLADGRRRLRIDTDTLEGGPTTFFEIAVLR